MYGGREESGGHYAYRLPKHPRLTRMQGFAEHMNGEAGPMQRGKQPRPLEDGNWVCDEPSCGNVNYPRRTECNKCGKRRGLLGDAVVKAYIDTIKIARDMAPGSGIAPHLVRRTSCTTFSFSFSFFFFSFSFLPLFLLFFFFL